MSDNVVDLSPKPRVPEPMAADVYTAQVDLRLTRIERVLSRLELQVWMIVCAIMAVCAIEVIALIGTYGGS